MNNLKLISPIPPSVNHYLGYRAIPNPRAKGKHMVVPYLTAEAKKFKKEFQDYAKKQVKLQGWDIEKTRDTHHYMDCIFYFPRTDMDEQNYFKVLSDALNDVVYIDDNRILTRTHKIYYDNKNPRIEITIRPVDYVGIFESQDEADDFVDKCKTCKRYSRNCSILKKSLEGRIQDEVDELLDCSKYNEK